MRPEIPREGEATELQRFVLAHVRLPESTECWEWEGSVNKRTGYGYAYLPSTRMTTGAHQAAYRAFHGAIPAGLWVLHHCDNRRCINPTHLYAGTALDNGRDARTRNRTAKGDRSSSRLYPERHPRGERTYNAKITEDDVREMRRLRLEGVSYAELAERFGLAFGSIGGIINRSRWAHVL